MKRDSNADIEINEQTTEATEKMSICEIGRQFDVLLDIVKVNTEKSIGE